jgi:hypothetical protein
MQVLAPTCTSHYFFMCALHENYGNGSCRVLLRDFAQGRRIMEFEVFYEKILSLAILSEIVSTSEWQQQQQQQRRGMEMTFFIYYELFSVYENHREIYQSIFALDLFCCCLGLDTFFVIDRATRQRNCAKLKIFIKLNSAPPLRDFS